jgi:centrosomal protein CEP41
LQKKTHANPKYADVRSQVKTGATAKNVSVVSDQLIAKRRGEKFKRIKTSTLAKLLNEFS